MKEAAPPAELRPAHMSDRAYVVETWLHSYRDSQFATRIPPDVYWSRFGHVGIVEATLEHSPVLVLCLPEEPEFIYGWACASGGVLHYAFVRHDFRRLGFGRRLLEALAHTEKLTHVTPDGSRLLTACGIQAEFTNPYKERR